MHCVALKSKYREFDEFVNIKLHSNHRSLIKLRNKKSRDLVSEMAIFIKHKFSILLFFQIYPSKKKYGVILKIAPSKGALLSGTLKQ